MITLTVFAFIAGIVTILSPCILPVLPVLLSAVPGKGRWRPAGILLGFVLTFTTTTLFLTAIASALHLPASLLRYVAAGILIISGIIQLVPRASLLLERGFSRTLSRMKPVKFKTADITTGGPSLNSAETANSPRKALAGFLRGLPIGASLGILWTPCVGPIMASVISLAVARNVDGGSLLITLSYAAGTTVPMAAVLLGGRRLAGRISPGAVTRRIVSTIFGVLLIAVAFLVISGQDIRLQMKILRTFPGYGSGLTSIESGDAVTTALRNFTADSRSTTNPDIDPSAFAGGDVIPEFAAVPGDYGFAPDLVADGPWLNSSELNMGDLKGTVVLVDFWTYSCINCIRTLPYLKHWHDEYGKSGLTIIGVHSPEFSFERSEENLQQAIEDLEIQWPIVMDNNFAQWQSYGNRFWPSHYLIDAEGRVRYFTFGEGHYRDTENMIQALLAEAGYNVIASPLDDSQQSFDTTPELYLGLRRAEQFAINGQPARLSPGETEYTLGVEPPADYWSLGGTWSVDAESLTAKGNSTIQLNYRGRQVYAVISPPTDTSTEITVTGGMEARTIRIDEPRMYLLMDHAKSVQGQLEIEVQEGTSLYTFTFGG